MPVAVPDAVVADGAAETIAAAAPVARNRCGTPIKAGADKTVDTIGIDSADAAMARLLARLAGGPQPLLG